MRVNLAAPRITNPIQLSQMKLIMDVAFSHPPGADWDGPLNGVQRLRLLFTDQTKVVTSAGGQNSVTQMIGSLLDAVEEQYGRFPTRLYRAFREGKSATFLLGHDSHERLANK